MKTQEPLFSVTACDCEWSYMLVDDPNDFKIEYLAELNTYHETITY